MTTLTAAEASEIFRTAPTSYLDVGAGEVACRTVGSGPDVLFVHGWPVSGATFRLLLPHLVDHVTCHVIDLPSAGSSRFTRDTPMSVHQHIRSVQQVVDLLGLESVALVGHDSGGLIARHAMVGDERLRALGLINTEPVHPGWRFRSFVATGSLPGFGPIFGWVTGQPKLRRFPLLLGDIFADSSLMDGEFDEFFLQPIHTDKRIRDASIRVLKSFDMQDVKSLANIHPRLNVPVKLVWGDRDPFFPVAHARAMVSSFPDASLEIIPGAGLFSHEERPAQVAQALLSTIA